MPTQQEIDEALKKLGQSPNMTPAEPPPAPADPLKFEPPSPAKEPEAPKPLPPVDLQPVQGAPEIPQTDKEKELASEPAPVDRTIFDAPVDADEPNMSVAPEPPVETTPEPTPAPAPAAQKPATQAAPGVTVVVQPSVQPGNIEDAGFDRTADTRTLRAQIAGTEAREVDLHREAADVAAEKVTAAQDVQKRREDTMQGLRTDAVLREGARKERAEETRARIVQEMEDLKAKMGKPPANAVGIIMGLVSAMAASQGKMGLASAFQSLGEQMNSPMRRWRAELEAGKESVEGMGKLIDRDRLLAADEAQAQEMISKAYDAELLSAAQFVQQNATNEKERIGAKVAEVGIINKRANEERARREAAAAAEYRRKVRAYIDAGETPEIRVARAKEHGEVGGQELQKGNKAMGSTLGLAEKGADLEKTDAEILALRAKAASDAAKAAENDPNRDITGNGFIPGWTMTKPLPPGLLVDIGKAETMYSTVETNLKRMLALSREMDKKGRDLVFKDENAKTEFLDLTNGTSTMKNNAQGAGAPSDAEARRQIETLPDPQEVLTRKDSTDILQRMLDNNNRQVTSRRRSLSIVPNDEYTAMRKTGGAPRAPAGPGAGTATVVDRETGESRAFPADQAAAIVNSDPDRYGYSD